MKTFASLASLPALAAALLLATGCYHISYVNGGAMAVPQKKEMHHIGILGLVEFSKPIPLKQICPNGFGRVDIHKSFIDGLVAGVTRNLYSPWTVEVYCGDGTAHLLQLNKDGDAVAGTPLLDSAEAALLESAEAPL